MAQVFDKIRIDCGFVPQKIPASVKSWYLHMPGRVVVQVPSREVKVSTWCWVAKP